MLATEDTVQDILQLDDLSASESELFKGISRWGIAKIQAEGKLKKRKVPELRAVVDSCIKLIRFMSMECKEFAEICTSPIVLSTDEKHQILLSLVLKDPKYMPENFNRSIITRQLTHSAIIYSTSYSYLGNGTGGHDENLQFSVNQSVNLLGFAIDLSDESIALTKLQSRPQHYGGELPTLKDMQITLLEAEDTVVSEGYSSNSRNVNGRDIILVSPPTTLKAGHIYNLKCTLSTTATYRYQIGCVNTSDWLHNSANKNQMQCYNCGIHQTNNMTATTQGLPYILVFSIHGSYANAPISGIIFNPHLDAVLS